MPGALVATFGERRAVLRCQPVPCSGFARYGVHRWASREKARELFPRMCHVTHYSVPSSVSMVVHHKCGCEEPEMAETRTMTDWAPRSHASTPAAFPPHPPLQSGGWYR